MKFPQTNKIMCAKCGTPIKSAKIMRDFAMHRTIFIVYCHGEEQIVELVDADLARVHSIGLTEAFKETVE